MFNTFNGHFFKKLFGNKELDPNQTKGYTSRPGAFPVTPMPIVATAMQNVGQALNGRRGNFLVTDLGQ
jgi:hypothetical protein